MKALVYGGPGRKSWIDVPLPTLRDPEDVIVQVDAVTICGTICTFSRVIYLRSNWTCPGS